MRNKEITIKLILGIILLVGLYIISFKNYLLFHSLAELFSILIAFTLFILARNCKEQLDNHYFLFIGIAYLFVGVLDLFHTLSYKGMGVFATSTDGNIPTQLWIAARYMESLSLLIAPVFIKRKLNTSYIFTVYLTLVAVILLSIFYTESFPACFIQGEGLTQFKKVSEYIISGFIICTIIILSNNKESFDKNVFRMLIASYIITVFAELAFTFYVSVYGLSNMIGHYFKLLSFYLLYKAVVETGFKRPYDILYRDLKQSEDKLNAVIQYISEGLIVTDKDNKIILMNRAAEKIFNVSFEEVLGKPVYESIKIKGLNDKIKGALNGKRIGFKFDLELPSEDSEHPRIMSAHTAMIYDNKMEEVGTVTIFSDVSFEREVERMKTKFLNIAAHELRNPLTSIMGFSEVLLSEDDIDLKKQRFFLSRIHSLSEDLEKIISDLLDISRIQAGKGLSLKKTVMNLNEYISGIVLHYNHLSKKHSLEYDLPEEDIEISLDKEKFNLLLNNLISNAYKYSPDGGTIRIIGNVSDDVLSVSVEDEGIGMTVEQTERVFEEFYRADPENSEIKGTGLGMTIVKHIIDLHKGHIWIESEKGKGTKVTFSLPLD